MSVANRSHGAIDVIENLSHDSTSDPNGSHMRDRRSPQVVELELAQRRGLSQVPHMLLKIQKR